MTRKNSDTAIAVDTAWSLAAEGSRLLSSLVSFLLVARTLGPTNYGVLAGATALVTVIVPFAHLGGPVLIVQRVRHHDLPLSDAYRLAISMTLAGAALGTGAVLLLAGWLLGDAPLEAILALAIGEYIFAAVVQCCSFAAISTDDYRFNTALVCGISAARLVAAFLFVHLTPHSVVGWTILQCACLAVGAIFLWIWSTRHLRIGFRLARVSRRDLRDGLPFCASAAALSAQDGLDKPLMVRFGWGAEAGMYGAAYRVPALAFLPVQALVVASFGRSFSEGRQGVRPALRLAQRLLVPALLYAGVVALVLVGLAPVFEPILGDGFAGSVGMVRWLAFLPVLRTLQYFAANSLTGAGLQTLRLRLMLIALLINLAACLILIPRYSWHGAVLATAIAEVTYAAMLWVTALTIARGEQS